MLAASASCLEDFHSNDPDQEEEPTAVPAALTCSWILERRKAELAAETRLAQNDWGKSGHVAPAQVFSGSEPLPANLANFRSFFDRIDPW